MITGPLLVLNYFSIFLIVGDDIRLNLHRNLIIITTSPLRITREAEITARDLMLGGVNIFVVSKDAHIFKSTIVFESNFDQISAKIEF